MKYITITLLLTSSSLWATGPTTWKISNLSNSKKTIKCQGTAKGLKEKIKLSSLVLKRNKTVQHQWKGYSNDGLGLNHTDWKCVVSGKEYKFNTDWGEHLKIVLSDSGLEVKK